MAKLRVNHKPGQVVGNGFVVASRRRTLRCVREDIASTSCASGARSGKNAWAVVNEAERAEALVEVRRRYGAKPTSRQLNQLDGGR